jgi:hypothetical protein
MTAINSAAEEGDNRCHPSTTSTINSARSHGVITDSICPLPLRQWISTQRLNYSKKHHLCNKPENEQYAISAARSITNAREEKLKVAGFVFSNARDAGKNQHSWKVILNELNHFKSTTGHLSVKAKDNERLYSWVRMQRITLMKKKLNVTPKEIKKRLRNIGLKY